MALVSNPKPGDDVSTRQAIARLGSSKLGPKSSPKFLGVTTTTLTITGLTDDSLIYPVSGLLTSLGVAADGQLPIGSTGATPVLATLTGTANQVNIANSTGSITLSTPQDIHTSASNFTVAGETITDLTASRLMSSSGAKVLSSVSDLTAWIAGTTDHISVADDSDGTVTLNLDTNTQTLLGSFNGIFLEKLDFTISEAGGTVTGSLEKDSGGDLIQRFSDGYTTLDCTPALTIDLTAYVGSNAVPKEVFVYVLQSAKTVMAASNSDWPSTEHCKVAHLVLKSAATTGTDGGALVNQNVNDFASAANGEGHLTHVEERLRKEPARWDSGTALTLKNSAGSALNTGSSSTAVEIVIATGQIYQLHRHTFPAFDMYTTATDDVHVVNQPTDEGGAYETTADLVTDVTHYVDGTAAGVSIDNNKYFNIVIWGIQNRGGEASHVMINLPSGQYTTEANATADADGTSVYDLPDAFEGTGFLIARLTFRKIAAGGGQWTYVAQEDLRGKSAPVSAGVSISTTDHALLSSLDYASAGHTGFLAEDGSVALAGAWDMGSQALTNVNIDSGDINVAVTNTEWDAAYTHVSNDGSDHSFLDQTVVIASSPTFVGLDLTGITDGYIPYIAAAGSADSPIFTDGTSIGIGTTNLTGATVAVRFEQNARPRFKYACTITPDGTKQGATFDFGLFSDDTGKYVLAGDKLGVINFLGQANDTTFQGGAIQTVVVTGGDITRSAMACRLELGAMGVGETGTFFGGFPDFCIDHTGFSAFGGEVAPETLIELTHITPYITLHNSTHEDGAGGRESRLIFKGEQSGGEETTLARIEASHDGAADDEKGKWILYVNDGNDADAPTQVLEIGSDLQAQFAGAVLVDTTFESTGVATLADASTLKTSAAPTTDAEIANKKYVDDTAAVDEKVKIDAAATAGYIGAANSDGVLRAGTGLSYVDGGDFVTLDLDINALTADASPVGSTDYVATYDDTASTEKKVLLDNFHRYVDRGDPAAFDFAIGDLTTDGTYYDLDCSGVVPAGATAIMFRVLIVDNTVGFAFAMRKNGNSNAVNIDLFRTQVSNVTNDSTFIVACDSNRVVEYGASSGTWDAINIAIAGWWLG